MCAFLFRGYKSIHQLRTDCLGPLERDIMAVVWEGGEMTVRTVRARLDQFVAYTTVMTTLDRLFRKGLLDRRKTGRAFAYQPIVTEDELDRAFARGAVSAFLRQDGQDPLPLLSSLVDVVSELDPELLNALERLVREKRQRGEKSPPT
jgi:predicted transcriptional regulator